MFSEKPHSEEARRTLLAGVLCGGTLTISVVLSAESSSCRGLKPELNLFRSTSNCWVQITSWALFFSSTDSRLAGKGRDVTLGFSVPAFY